MLLSRHHIGTTPVPATSPYALMRDYPAYILLLGVGLEMCTAIHHPEEVIAPEIYVKPAETAESYELRDRAGNILKYSLRRHQRLDRNFPKFAPRLAAKGQYAQGEIGGVPWALVKASDLLREVFAALIARPDATIGP
jgi:aminoglycoside 3-N-acetyltransferase